MGREDWRMQYAGNYAEAKPHGWRPVEGQAQAAFACLRCGLHANKDWSQHECDEDAVRQKAERQRAAWRLPTAWRKTGEPVSQEKYIPISPPYPLSKDVTEALIELDHALLAENRDLLCVGIKDVPEGLLFGHVRLFDPSKLAVNESVAVLQRRCDEAVARAGRECDHWKIRALGSETRIRELESALVKSNALRAAELANPIMLVPAGIPVQLPAAADGRYLQVHVTASSHIDVPRPAPKFEIDPVLRDGREMGTGIEKLPPRDDSHYVLDVDLLADDA